MVSWAPPMFVLCALRFLSSKGLKSLDGEVNKKVFLKHGAVGPAEFPAIQVLDDPHQPHDP